MTTDTVEQPVVVAAPPSPVAEFVPTAQAVADFMKRFEGKTFDVTTTAGDREARAARKELVTLRTGLDKLRKEIKAPMLERIQLLDGEAKRLTALIVDAERPIDYMILAEEKRKAADKAERERLEADRVRWVEELLQRVRQMPIKAASRSAMVIKSMMTDLADLQVDFDLGEQLDLVKTTVEQSLQALRDLHAAAVEREAEQQRLREERARIEAAEVEAKRQRLAEAKAQRDREEALQAQLREQQAELERMRHAEAERERAAAMRQAAAVRAAAPAAVAPEPPEQPVKPELPAVAVLEATVDPITPAPAADDPAPPEPIEPAPAEPLSLEPMEALLRASRYALGVLADVRAEHPDSPLMMKLINAGISLGAAIALAEDDDRG